MVSLLSVVPDSAGVSFGLRDDEIGKVFVRSERDTRCYSKRADAHQRFVRYGGILVGEEGGKTFPNFGEPLGSLVFRSHNGEIKKFRTQDIAVWSASQYL